MKLFTVLLSIFLLSACNDYSDNSLKESLLKRVSFDFECQAKDVHLTELSRTETGKKARVKSCVLPIFIITAYKRLI